MILADLRPMRPDGVLVAPVVREEVRAFLRLALPLALVALVNMGMGVTDAAMVSLLFGPAALAAVAVGSDLYSIVFYLGAGLLAGLSPLYAAAASSRDGATLGRLRRVGAVLVLGLSLVLVPAVVTAPEWLVALGLEPGLLAEGAGYTRAMALTLVPMLGVMLVRTLLTAAERPGLFLKATLWMLPLNAALMLGLGPVPALGPTGAGVSSLLVASTILAVLLLPSAARRPARRRSEASTEPP